MRKMKNYLEAGILFATLFLTLSCEKNDFIDKIESNQQTDSFLNDIRTSTNTFDFFLKQQNLMKL